MKKPIPSFFKNYTLFSLLLIIAFSMSLSAQPCTFISDNFNLGGPSHDPGFQENDNTNMTAVLSNGNFVVAWETRDDVDGDRHGGFFQVFSEDGTTVTDVIIPYTDVNPAGTGDQGTFGPKVVALQTGFVIAWNSENGPGDTGPTDPDANQQDVFFRVYNNDGSPVSGSTRLSIANSDDGLSFVLPLNTGGFVILTHVNEDDVDTRDDYYFEALNASGTSLSGGLINLTGGAHDPAFQTINRALAMVDLGGGNFAVTWETRDDIDGNGHGAFFRIFNTNGTAVTNVIMPYADINAAGTGDQGTGGSRIISLENGNFVVAWQSREAPGDVGPDGSGPGDDDNQDIYFRIYNPNGTAVTATLKANSDNIAETEQLSGLVALTGGGFAFYYHREENDPANNKDDYFVRAFNADGTAAGASFEVSSGAHLENFCAVNGNNHGLAALNNGNFVVGWAARDDADGDDAGAFYRVFNSAGSPVSPVTTPYADINPSGTGKQSTFGPLLEALPDGFTIGWQSLNGPGDVGPTDDMQDVYHRVIDNNGSPLCGSTKTCMGNDAEEEDLLALQALANGDFIVTYKDEESSTGNKDDFFVRVIGGAPLQIVCPALGTVTTSTSTTCVDEPFNITVTGLQNMAMSDNNDQDYGLRFVAFANSTGDPYSGGTLLGTVPFGSLTGGGTTANLTGVSISMADPDLFIYAILDPGPADAGCTPSAQATIGISDFPDLTFTQLPNFCIDAVTVPFSNLATPQGGVYSGPGVTDFGDGTTFNFNPSTANVGTHEITYTYTDPNGCTASTSITVIVFDLPAVGFDQLPDFCINAGVQFGLSGGTPTGGVYSGPGVTDDGNGMTFSFNPSDAGVGLKTITYSYSDANGCFGSSADELEVFTFPSVTYTGPGAIGINDGVQTLSGGMPTGGTYSGPGVTGTNFDPMVAGVGMHVITYTYTDANGCIGTATDVITVSAPTPGDECIDANDINNLFGQALGEPQVSGLYDNSFYTSTPNDPTSGFECFFNGDGLQHTIWYTFVGDGNTYNIKTIECNASNYITDGDTQMAIYTGDCGNFTPVACNEDEDGNNSIFNTNIDLLTEPGVTYYIMIDGWNNAIGEYCVQVTLSELTNVIDIADTNIELFPNPTSGELNLRNVEAEEVEVYDQLGRLAKRFVEPGNTLNISNLSSGLYIIKIRAGEEFYAAKILKE